MLFTLPEKDPQLSSFLENIQPIHNPPDPPRPPYSPCDQFLLLANALNSININTHKSPPPSRATTSKPLEEAIESVIQRQNATVAHLLEREKQEERRREEERRKQEERRREEERREKERQEEARRKEEERKEAERKEAERKEQERKEQERKEAERKEQERKEEERKRAEIKQAEERKALEKKRLEEKAKENTAEHEFLQYKAHIKAIKENVVGPLNADPNMKKQAGVVRRQINPKFGQLTDSRQQLRRVSDAVIASIASVQSVELGYKWVLNFVAKALVDQAETEVIVSTKSALPLAHLAVAILQRFPDFFYYLKARLVKKCPFIVGYSRTIDTEEGRTAMGWRRNDGKWEDEVKYDERVSGIATLWAVITTLGSKEFPMADSWRFAARMANTPRDLLTNTHYSVVCAWWEASGEAFLSAYGKQSVKVMRLLSEEWVEVDGDRRFPAAARLWILGEEWRGGRMVGLPNMIA